MLCMNLAELDACDDIAALRQTAKSSLLEHVVIRATLTRHEQELHYRQRKIDALLFELARLKRWRWAAQSEQLSAHQRHLFEEGLEEDIRIVEQTLEALPPVAPDPAASAPAVPKRQTLPAHLPRIEHRYERVDCQCKVCREPLTVIGEDCGVVGALAPYESGVPPAGTSASSSTASRSSSSCIVTSDPSTPAGNVRPSP